MDWPPDNYVSMQTAENWDFLETPFFVAFQKMEGSESNFASLNDADYTRRKRGGRGSPKIFLK